MPGRRVFCCILLSLLPAACAQGDLGVAWGSVAHLVEPPAPADSVNSVAFWTVAEVAEWLSESGHGPFVDAFARESIDGQHLLHLRLHHLREYIGATSGETAQRIECYFCASVGSLSDARSGMAGCSERPQGAHESH
eukprot:SAG11_NODE_7151_length_1186_cov_1.182153_2_plen_137_part_00